VDEDASARPQPALLGDDAEEVAVASDVACVTPGRPAGAALWSTSEACRPTHSGS